MITSICKVATMPQGLSMPVSRVRVSSSGTCTLDGELLPNSPDSRPLNDFNATFERMAFGFLYSAPC